MVADEPAVIAEITLIQSTFQKEEPAKTGALAGIAGGFTVTSESDSALS
jgi:hypothetical protein